VTICDGRHIGWKAKRLKTPATDNRMSVSA
jgi:hypothetical protein